MKNTKRFVKYHNKIVAKKTRSEEKTKFLNRIADFLEKCSIIRIWVRLNQSAALIALAIATFGFLLALTKYNEDNQKTHEDRIAKAWDVVTKMSGKQSNGGQINAIERLNSYSIPLDYVDLHNTFLAGVKLRGASLRNANLSGANLTGADLQGTNFQDANLSGAILTAANLGGVSLDGAKLNEAKLIFTRSDLSIVLAKDLKNANLTGIKFVFEDEEGGEKWELFSDTLAEALDIKDMQELVNSACADSKYNQDQSKYLEITPPSRNCKDKIDYEKIYLVTKIPKDIEYTWGTSNPFK